MPLTKCKCLYLTELNIELNIIQKKYVRICSKHSEKIFETNIDKINYRFCKKKNAYIFRGISSIKLEENILDFNDKDWYGVNHINNLRSISRKNSDKNSNKNTESNCGNCSNNSNNCNCDNSETTEETEDSYEDISQQKKVLFGKYSGFSFEELLEKDKNYCINIMNIESNKSEEEKSKMPSSMVALSNFIKNTFSR